MLTSWLRSFSMYSPFSASRFFPLSPCQLGKQQAGLSGVGKRGWQYPLKYRRQLLLALSNGSFTALVSTCCQGLAKRQEGLQWLPSKHGDSAPNNQFIHTSLLTTFQVSDRWTIPASFLEGVGGTVNEKSTPIICSPLLASLCGFTKCAPCGLRNWNKKDFYLLSWAAGTSLQISWGNKRGDRSGSLGLLALGPIMHLWSGASLSPWVPWRRQRREHENKT